MNAATPVSEGMLNDALGHAQRQEVDRAGPPGGVRLATRQQAGFRRAAVITTARVQDLAVVSLVGGVHLAWLAALGFGLYWLVT